MSVQCEPTFWETRKGKLTLVATLLILAAIGGSAGFSIGFHLGWQSVQPTPPIHVVLQLAPGVTISGPPVSAPGK